MTTITNPGNETRAVFLRSHIRLLALGMKNSRGLTLTQALKEAGALTGKTYKRTQHEAAREDLKAAAGL